MRKVFKKVIWLALAVVAVGALALLFYSLVQSPSKKAVVIDNGQKKGSACDILPVYYVYFVLGNTSQNKNAANPKQSNKDVVVSSCKYVQTNPPAGSQPQQLTLVAIKPTDKAGVKANQAVFAHLPAGSQSIAKLGNAAYWDPSGGQINILKNGNWYSITFGSDKASERSLQQTLPQAKSLVSRF